MVSWVDLGLEITSTLRVSEAEMCFHTLLAFSPSISNISLYIYGLCNSDAVQATCPNQSAWARQARFGHCPVPKRKHVRSSGPGSVSVRIRPSLSGRQDTMPMSAPSHLLTRRVQVMARRRGPSLARDVELIVSISPLASLLVRVGPMARHSGPSLARDARLLVSISPLASLLV